MHEKEETDEDLRDDEGDLDDSWDEPHVPTLTGIGVAPPASVRGASGADPARDQEADLTPDAKERRRKKKAAQQKALEAKRAFAAASQKKKKPAAEKAKARASHPPEEDAPKSSVRPAAKASKQESSAEVLKPSDVRKLEKEAQLRSQTKVLFAFAALVVALIAIGFYLH